MKANTSVAPPWNEREKLNNLAREIISIKFSKMCREGHLLRKDRRYMYAIC